MVVVEHDREAMEESDWLIDFGPGAGRHGGEIVAAGTPAEVMANKNSLTGRYLRDELRIELPAERRRGQRPQDHGGGRAREQPEGRHRRLPARGLRLRHRGLGRGQEHPRQPDPLPRGGPRPARQRRAGGRPRQRRSASAEIDKVIDIDQSPIGRTPRSNPATYTKLFDLIRDFFALLPEARMHGYTPGRFSFNVKGGRCEACEGDGVKRVEMHFLADVYVPCEVCHGQALQRGHPAGQVQRPLASPTSST